MIEHKKKPFVVITMNETDAHELIRLLQHTKNRLDEAAVIRGDWTNDDHKARAALHELLLCCLPREETGGYCP
jgi:hypothetical protein